MGWYTWYRRNDTEECHWLGSLYHTQQAQISCFSGSYLISWWPLIGQGGHITAFSLADLHNLTQTAHSWSHLDLVWRLNTMHHLGLTPDRRRWHTMPAVHKTYDAGGDLKGWHGESSNVKSPSVYQISLCAAIKGGWHSRCAFIDGKNHVLWGCQAKQWIVLKNDFISKLRSVQCQIKWLNKMNKTPFVCFILAVVQIHFNKYLNQ